MFGKSWNCLRKRGRERVFGHAVIPALLLVLAHPAFGQKPISAETISQVERTVVPLVCLYTGVDNRTKVEFVMGTGFFVDHNGRFVTDAHVLTKWNQTEKETHPCYPAVYVPDSGWDWKAIPEGPSFEVFPFHDCQYDESLDLAVCTPDENPFYDKKLPPGRLKVATFDTTFRPEGTTIAFTGFPIGREAPITSEGIIAGYGTVSGSRTAFDYYVDKAAWPGASGSPLYLSDGRLVGIVRWAGEGEWSGISMARSASTIVGFLAKHPYANKKALR